MPLSFPLKNCFTFLLFTIGLMGSMPNLFGQSFIIRVRDQIDFSPISGVKITWKTDSAQFGMTNEKGLLILDHKPDESTVFSFTQPDFDSLQTTVGEIALAGGEVFLQSKSVNLSEIVITAHKSEERTDELPQRFEVIKAREIAFQNPSNSGEMLAQQGQVFVQQSQMGGGSPIIRGFEANKVLLVVDGVRMNNAIFRGGHLQSVITIDPNMVERAEVLFGPASVVYGSDALGGVMHFISRKPVLSSGKKPHFKINMFTRYATANREKTGHIDFNIGLKRVGFLTSFTVSDFEDLRSGGKWFKKYPDFGRRDSLQVFVNGTDSTVANDKPTIQRQSGYRQYDVMQKVLFLQSERVSHGLNFQYSISSDVPRYDRLAQYGSAGLSYGEWYYGPQKRMLVSYNTNLNIPNPVFEKGTFTLAFQDIEESRISRRYGRSSKGHRIEKVRVLSANLDFSKNLPKRNELEYGLEFNQNWVASTAFSEDIITGVNSPLDTRYPDGGSQMRFLAAYACHKWEISEKLFLSDGLRFTDVYLKSRFDNKDFFSFLPDQIVQSNRALSGNIGLVALPGAQTKLSISFSTGFRSPNVDDLGKVFDSSPGNVIVPNANVKPEYTYNGEFSVEKRLGKLIKIDATVFYTWFDQALVIRDFTVNGLDSISYDGVRSKVQAVVNAGRAMIYGVNANLSLDFLKFFTLSHAITWTYGRDLSNDVPLDHIPPLYGRGSFSFKMKRLRADAYVIYNAWKPIALYSPSGEDNQSQATPDGTPAWFTLNLKTSVAVNPWLTLQLGLENLLNQHYRRFGSGISAPGINLIGAVRASF